MKKLDILTRITESGVVAVVRADSKDEAIKISKACIQGGIGNIEITYTIECASEVIRELVEEYRNDHNVVIGAGTVLDVTTARLSILSGAGFVVSPSFDEETAKLCNLYQIPYMPGCMTISEMKKALEFGADIIKCFPGSVFGAEFVKAVKGPLPAVNLMPTGGVSLDNVAQWIKNESVAVGIGGNLIAPAKAGDYDKITENAKQYVQKVKEARDTI